MTVTQWISNRAMVAVLLVLTFVAPAKAEQLQYNTIRDIAYYSAVEQQQDDYLASRCKLDLYYPLNSKDFPTVVWFHGGGLVEGEKHIPEGLLQQGVAVVAVNYRLYPKVKAPVYIEDAAASVAWVFNHITQYGGSKDKIFLSGHSAGGYLASMVGLDKHYLKKYNIDAYHIAGLIPFSGHTITHFTVREERGIEGTQPIVDNLAPLYFVNKDAPPLLLITGDRELELLGRYEENAYIMRMMKVAGHQQTRLMELDGYGHDIVMPAVPLLLNEIKRIVAE